MYYNINKENIDSFQIDDVITKNEDAFSRELTIQTNLYEIRSEYRDVNNNITYFKNQKDYKLPGGKKVNFDIHFKSSPNGEEIYIYPKYYGRELAVDELIFLINGSTNITLKKYAFEDYFSISKIDFVKCCEAKTLCFQFRRDNRRGYEDTSSREDIILYFQALYHDAIDDTKYQNAKETLKIICQKELEEFKDWQEAKRKDWDNAQKKEEKRKTSMTIIGVILIVLGVVLMVLAANSKFDATGSACLVFGLVFVVVGFTLLMILKLFY